MNHGHLPATIKHLQINAVSHFKQVKKNRISIHESEDDVIVFPNVTHTIELVPFDSDHISELYFEDAFTFEISIFYTNKGKEGYRYTTLREYDTASQATRTYNETFV
jgi:hypothetical protein